MSPPNLPALLEKLSVGNFYGVGETSVEARRLGKQLLVRRLTDGYAVEHAWLLPSEKYEKDSCTWNPFGFGAFGYKRTVVPNSEKAAELFVAALSPPKTGPGILRRAYTRAKQLLGEVVYYSLLLFAVILVKLKIRQ